MDMLKDLLLIFACLLGFVHAIDDHSGFTSIDCGLPIGSDYTDVTTGINYISDAGLVDTGVSSTILPEFNESSLVRQFWTLRSFPQEKRNCYNLKPAGGKGTQYLIRASFMYGNYDAKSLPPTFDLYLGVGLWYTVVINDPSSFTRYEIIHILTSDDINLCLINTNKGIPFISALELRSLSSNLYPTESGSLALNLRWNFGSLNNELVRFRDDAYDRIWSPVNGNKSTISSISTLSDINILDNQLPPSIVMKTAITPKDATGDLTITWDPYNSTDQYYFYFYFAEVEVLQPNQLREFNIYLNGLLLYGPYSPNYLTSFGAVSYSALSASQCKASDRGNYHCEILIKQTERSTLPPIINALEIYTVKKFLDTETDENDVGAIMSIKSVYGVTRNWQGDPCAPEAYAWDGLNCSYNDYSSSPRIISLNLSSSGLSGVIAPYISNLTLLESLDLSYNSLRGDVPEFLTQLASLRILYLKGNNFTGSIPAQLLEKQGKGLLSLSIDGPANTPYPSPPVKKKKKLIVPIVASSAGAAVLVLLTASVVILWLIKQRKQQVARKVETVSLGKGGNLETRKRLFKYSEVQKITNNFQRTVGKGGFGSVYYGHVDGIGPVAVKMLSPESAQGHNEFKAEAKLLLTVHHKNLTSLVGYCNEATHKGIIYEYMANGDLNKHLSDTRLKVLSWEERLRIAVDTANGLDYLHHGCKPPMIHRDVKTTNILLTENFQAKLADFGLSRKCPIEGDTQPSTAVAGTLGYLDPEYNSDSRLTEKSDVYSFGVVLLVIITGRPAIANGTTHITQWVRSMLQKGDVTYIVDPKLKGDFDVISVQKAVALARACVVGPSTKRPTMNNVVTELKECLVAETDYRDTECKDSIGQGSMNLESGLGPRAR